MVDTVGISIRGESRSSVGSLTSGSSWGRHSRSEELRGRRKRELWVEGRKERGEKEEEKRPPPRPGDERHRFAACVLFFSINFP